LSTLILAAALGCSNLGQYVWADSLPDASPASEYVLASGDAINVRVFNQESISGRTRVRPDGRVTIAARRIAAYRGPRRQHTVQGVNPNAGAIRPSVMKRTSRCRWRSR
jgi:protein involved in polysaccharide export with SLBB domain